MEERLDAFRAGTEAATLSILSEPYVVMTRRGYVPAVTVEVAGEAEKRMLYISSYSISAALEPLVEENGDKFTGIKLTLRKESDDRFAKYVVETPGS